MREPGRIYWAIWYVAVAAFLLLQIWLFTIISQQFH